MSAGIKPNVNEKMVTEAWQTLLTTGCSLTTETGQSVNVIYPGKSTDGAGSDFQDAVIAVGRKTLHGNIELHVNSSDWHNHGHDRNPAYNNVVLHVALQQDKPGNITLQNGAVIPAVTINRFLHIGPDTMLADRVPCAGMGAYYPEKLLAVIERAGTARFQEKAAQFQKQLQTAEPAQCLYAGIMTALGYAKNKEPFRALAERVPLVELASLVNNDFVAAQAVLMGSAGLLPSQRPECEYSPREDYAFVAELETAWARSGRVETMTPSDWQPFRVRPANSPLRRMAGMCVLLTHYRSGLLEGLIELVRQTPPGDGRLLQKGLMAEGGGYWAGRYDFGKGFPGLSPWLIAEARAADIVINVLLPFVCVWGKEYGEPELAEKAFALFVSSPASETNTVERHMKTQFGLRSAQINSAQRQQGLLHLYKKWCTQGRCGDCEVARKY